MPCKAGQPSHSCSLKSKKPNDEHVVVAPAKAVAEATDHPLLVLVDIAVLDTLFGGAVHGDRVGDAAENLGNHVVVAHGTPWKRVVAARQVSVVYLGVPSNQGNLPFKKGNLLHKYPKSMNNNDLHLASGRLNSGLVDADQKTQAVSLDITKAAMDQVNAFLKRNPGLKQKFVIATAVEMFASLDPKLQFALMTRDPALRRDLSMALLYELLELKRASAEVDAFMEREFGGGEGDPLKRSEGTPVKPQSDVIRVGASNAAELGTLLRTPPREGPRRNSPGPAK